MAKGKTAQKWKKEEKAVVVPFKVVGGPLNGYDVVNLEGESQGHFDNMWDAIYKKRELLGEDISKYDLRGKS